MLYYIFFRTLTIRIFILRSSSNIGAANQEKFNSRLFAIIDKSILSNIIFNIGTFERGRSVHVQELCLSPVKIICPNDNCISQTESKLQCCLFVL